MDNVGYVSLSRAAMLERVSDVTANNIANANAEGFRAKRASFETLVVDTQVETPTRMMAYAIDKGTYVDLSQGAMSQTGNQFDVAIQGDAWFGFQRSDGEIALGRGGALLRDLEGNLVTSEGHAILDIGGGAVNIPDGSGDVSIGKDGTITAAGGEVLGQIGLFEAPSVSHWQSLDGAMFKPREGETPLDAALNGEIAQGFVEGSNVNPVMEMTRMIRQQREFERSMNMADAADGLRKTTIERLGRS